MCTCCARIGSACLQFGLTSAVIRLSCQLVMTYQQVYSAKLLVVAAAFAGVALPALQGGFGVSREQRQMLAEVQVLPDGQQRRVTFDSNMHVCLQTTGPSQHLTMSGCEPISLRTEPTLPTRLGSPSSWRSLA